jgi:virginiamycin B lyase
VGKGSPPGKRRGTRGQRVAAVVVAAGLVGAAVLVTTRARDGASASKHSFPSTVAVHTASGTITPVEHGRVTVWPLPEKLVGPRDVLVTSDGAVWTTEQDRGLVDALRGGTLTRYGTDAFQDVGAFGLALGPGEAVWFTGYPGGSVGRILPDGTANGFQPVLESTVSTGIAQAPDGTMWVTLNNPSALERIGPDGAVSSVGVVPPPGIPTAKLYPRDITRAVDGTMWFTDPGTGAVGRVTTASSPSGEERLIAGGGHQPRSIAAAPDGSLWVTLTDERALAEIDPTTGDARIVPVKGATGTLNDLLVAPDGTIWISEAGPYLLHVKTDGATIERVKLPDGIVYTDGLSQAPDGTIWAAATDASALVAVTPAS